MKYALILEFKGQYSILMMCRALQVSRSGFYSWYSRPRSSQDQRREKMEHLIVDTFESFRARYGAPRLADEITALGFPCSTNYVASIMKSRGIRARNGKGFNYSRHGLTMLNVSENLLWRDFSTSKPNEKWTTDITYIWVKDKWLYLATVMDLYSRKIVGWTLDHSMTEKLVIEALSMAYHRRKPGEGLVIHSDRGTQYRAQKYIDLMESKGSRPSMSRKGNCWDNAPMESFFSRLKVELIYAEQYTTVSEASSGIFEYIEIFYNRKRRHSANDNVSPVEFEEMAANAA